MSQKIFTVIYVLIVVAIVGALGWYIYRDLTPNSEAINNEIISPVTIYSPDMLDNPAVQQTLPHLVKNGNVPIVISPDELGRTNPFTNY